MVKKPIGCAKLLCGIWQKRFPKGEEGINNSSRYGSNEVISAFNILNERCRKGECSGWWAPLGLAWIYKEIGREDEARAHMSEALKINPNLSLEGHERSEVFKNRAHLQRELLNLRDSGMPQKPLGEVQLGSASDGQPLN